MVCRDADSARDVSQVVFTDLALKAGQLGKKVSVSGWLYRAASLSASKFVRGQVRRNQREKIAMETMSSISSSITLNSVCNDIFIDNCIPLWYWLALSHL